MDRVQGRREMVDAACSVGGGNLAKVTRLRLRHLRKVSLCPLVDIMEYETYICRVR